MSRLEYLGYIKTCNIYHFNDKLPYVFSITKSGKSLINKLGEQYE